MLDIGSLVYDVRKEPNYTKLEAKEDWLPSLEGDTDCSLDHINLA